MSGALQPLRLATDLVTSAPVQCFHSRYGVNGSIWQQAYWGGQFSPTKASVMADLVLLEMDTQAGYRSGDPVCDIRSYNILILTFPSLF